MTRDEAIRPFKMLSANWPFLDFTNDTTFEIWFDALEPFHEAEIRQGVKDAIANITKTPTVADVLEYVRNVHDGFRRLEDEQEAASAKPDEVRCELCNDYGWQTIIYPTGYETVRPCSCAAARKAFGEKELKREFPAWWGDMMFGPNEIPSQYELVRVSRMPVPTGEKYIDSKGRECDRKTWGWVPYFPRQGREEIFLQYQKRSRK